MISHLNLIAVRKAAVAFDRRSAAASILERLSWPNGGTLLDRPGVA